MTYEGKWALVTGAGRMGRIGAAIAKRLAQEGANIFLHHRLGGESEAEQVANEVRQAGEQYQVKVELVAADLTNTEDLNALFARVAPDIVVHNAAVFEPAEIPENATPAEVVAAHEQAFDHNIDVNLKAPFLATVAAIEALKRAGKTGTFVFIGDAFIERGGAYDVSLGGYVLSKAGAKQLAEFFAARYGKEGFRFLAIMNGPIEPPPSAPTETVEGVKGEINIPDEKLDPWIGPDRVAAAVVAIINLEGVNGASLQVDGGREWRQTGSEHEKPAEKKK